MEEEDDERREAAIASAASLQANFGRKSGVTSAQLSKFQELHQRRLQLKAKSKPKKKTKGLIAATGKFTQKDNYAEESIDVRSNSFGGDSGSLFPADDPYAKQEEEGNRSVPKEHKKKLHWGLDTKERWEMKANM